MKIFSLLLVIIGLFISCSEETKQKSDVELFIEQVKSDQYTADTLPEYSPDAIPVLLKYADDFSEITHFPINPISSFAPLNMTIGECLMWTVEFIRLYYGNYSGSIQFPSLVPELKLRSSPYGPDLDESQLHEAYNLYYDWWYNNEGYDFEETRLINPLEGSDYRWY